MTRQPTLRAYVDAHKGERILVCGMGTSIDQFPLSFYENWPGPTIGVNEIVDLFTPDYHFANYVYYPHLENTILVKGLERPVSFEYTSPSMHIDVGKTGKLSKRGTVAMPAFTMAFQLGAAEIYLIGVDLNSGSDGRIYFKECSKKAPEWYQLADEKNPEQQATIRCFADAFKQYKARGVKVFNLSLVSRFAKMENIETIKDFDVANF